MFDYITIKDTIAKILKSTGTELGLELIPDFIAMAETKIYRTVRIPSMENIVSLTTDLTDGFIVLPADFLELIALSVTTSDKEQWLEQRPYGLVSTATRTGNPLYYARKDNQIIFDPKPDEQKTLQMYYYRQFDALSSSNPNNYFSNNAPDVLIYGALSEAAPLLTGLSPEMAIAMERAWTSKFERALADLQNMAASSQWSGSALSVR